MKGIRILAMAVATSGAIALGTQAQVQQQIQIDPSILTERPVFVPDLKLKILDLPDLAITELRGPSDGPNQAGDLELIINLQNFSKSLVSLKFLDADGQIQPTLDVVYLAPGQSLIGYLTGSAAGDETPIVKRVFLETVLEPGQKLSHARARADQPENLISVSLPGFREQDPVLSGVHRLAVILDPEETLIELSRRNNMADYTWSEEPQAVAVQTQRGLMELTLPVEKPAKQKAPELRPFQ